MTSITLPADLEAWAQAEVAAGRAESVEAQRLRDGQKWDAFVQSLKDAEAEADRDGWLDADEVFHEIQARYADQR